MSYLIKKLFVTTTLITACACGGGSDSAFSGGANVVKISMRDSSLSRGDGTVVSVDFAYDADTLYEGEDLVLVVKLPKEVEYRDGTAEVDGVVEDDKVGIQILNCAESGESYIVFDLDKNDLDTADDPSGDADARVKFTIDTKAATLHSFIGARSEFKGVFFSCSQVFISDSQTTFSIE